MIRINLLPVRATRKQEAVRRHLILFVAGLAVVLLVGFGLYQAKNSDYKQVAERNARLQREINDLTKIIGEVEVFKEQQALLNKKLEVIRRLKANKTGPVHMLDELATHIPDKLWLEQIDEAQQRATLKGVSINNEVIATFMSRLEESPYFAEVYLVSIERTKKEDLKLKNFTITARLVVPGFDNGGAG